MKKTLIKSILLAIFGMMVVQNVNAQKISADEEVATNIGGGLSVGSNFFYGPILYEVTAVEGTKYTVNAIAFYGSSFDAEIEIIGSGEANGYQFEVAEIESLNSALVMNGTNYTATGAGDLGSITTLLFVDDEGNGFAGTIADGAFGNLSGVEYIYTDLTTVPEAGDEAFWGLFENDEAPVLVVPTGCMGKYGTAEGWQYFYIYTDLTGARFGDINGDGSVNINDVSALLEYQDFGEIENGTLNTESVDVNGDGNENINDVSALLGVLDYVGD
ncbi:MAG: dockerin type I repeat-containing protein [Prevotella sp.]|nr:dockerin type I repeat-containing protein [Prevotella sp.]